MILERFPEIQKLTAEEKLLFVSELWEEIESSPAAFPVSEDIVKELDRRMERFHAAPDEITTWEMAKARIRGSKQ